MELHNHSAANSAATSMDHHILWPNPLHSTVNQILDHNSSILQEARKRTTTRRTKTLHPRMVRDMKRRTRMPTLLAKRRRLRRNTAQRSSNQHQLLKLLLQPSQSDLKDETWVSNIEIYYCFCLTDNEISKRSSKRARVDTLRYLSAAEDE